MAQATQLMLQAAERGRLDGVKLLVEQDVTLVEATNAYGYRPLMLAAEHGHLAVVKYLVQCGADINPKSRSRRDTAVELALRHGQVEVAIFLLEKGASISAYDLRRICCDAVSGGNVGTVRFVLWREGYDVDEEHFRCGGTPLRAATMEGHAGVVQALLEAGANPFLLSGECVPINHATATLVTSGRVNSHACVKAFEEWQRAYLLTKGQCLHEAVRSITSVKHAHKALKSNNEKRAARIAAAPAYLQTRARDGTIMPRVEIPRVHHDGGVLQRQRGGKRKGGRSVRVCSEGVRRAVVGHVVSRLTSELCMELVGVMGLAAVEGGVRSNGVKNA